MRLMRPLRSHAPNERGAAIVELAMVIPLMLLMLLVLYDFGRGYLAFISITNSARDAARVAMQDDKECKQTDLQTTATNSAAPYAITLVVSEDENSGVCTVTVSHTYVPVLPFVTGSFSLPGIGQVGPLWSGTMSETMKSQ